MYCHLAHAGNLADVFKHALLSLLLLRLARDDAFCYIDTHAGAGCYDLWSAQARNGGEAQRGILELWRQRAGLPELHGYFSTVAEANSGIGAGPPRFYPGSPLIARQLTRDCHRLVLMERVADTASLLRVALRGETRAEVLNEDGYSGLDRVLRACERPALVLIDPPFVDPRETQAASAGLRAVRQAWPSASCALWYPITEALPDLPASFDCVEGANVLDAKLRVMPATAGHMEGCGMLVANPPAELVARLADLLMRLAEILGGTARSNASVRWVGF